jgi:hypothetical protein
MDTLIKMSSLLESASKFRPKKFMRSTPAHFFTLIDCRKATLKMQFLNASEDNLQLKTFVLMSKNVFFEHSQKIAFTITYFLHFS